MTRRRPDRKKNRRKFSNFHLTAAVVLSVLIMLASVSAFEWLRGVFLNSSMFVLRGISIQGNSHVESADILDAADLSVGASSVYSVAPHILARRLEAQFRYLERVEVQRRLNGWLTIVVKEREPVALVADSGGSGFMVIDARCFVLEEGLQDMLEDVPVIVGFDGRKLLNGQHEHTESVDLALDVLASVRSVVPEVSDEVSLLDARDPDRIALHLRAHSASSATQSMSGAVIRIASDQIEEGLGNIIPVMMEREQENKQTRYLDARFPGTVYCMGASDG